MMDGELQAFEEWYGKRQQARGFEAGPLISPERGILKYYLFYAATKDE